MANAFIQLTEESQKLLVSYANICFQRYNMETARSRFERVDKAVQLEEKSRREKVEDYYDDITMPVVKPPVRKISNFLIRMFTANPAIFESTSSLPERANAVKQMNAVIEENAKTSKWSRELMLFFKDLPKYNVGCISCDWVSRNIATIGNSPDLASTASTVTSNTRSGNEFKRYDMYNTFYDTTVAVNEVSDRGDFIGTIERMTSHRLYSFLADLKSSLGATALLNSVTDREATGGSTTRRFYTPDIVTSVETQSQMTDIESLFHGYGGHVDMSKNSKGKLADPTGMHEVVTLHVRVVPSMFKVNVPDADTMQIWKLTIHNWNKIVMAEKLTNAHGVFPVVICQIDEEGIGDQVKSAAELLIPMQNLQTKYYDARMQGLKRNLSDRALYSSSRIDKQHFESDNPSAKIPVKPNMLNPGLDHAYRQIPFQDNLGGSILQELGYLGNVANRISGLNDPQQGNFQKGNKTLGEFNEIMQNADDDLVTWASLVEVVAMGPLKFIVKTNILQYQSSSTITNADATVEVDPIMLRKSAVDFKLADGLISKETLMDLPTARSLFELLLQSPQLQAYYGEKLPELVEYVFSSTGFDTSKFRGTNPAALQPQATGAPNDGQPAAQAPQ